MNHKSAAALKSSSSKSIQQWLESPNAHSSIKHARQLLLLEQDWQQALLNALSTRQAGLGSTQKQLIQHTRVASLTKDELVVLVQSAAIRTKLQLNAFELIAYLQTRGWQISAVRFQVQEYAAVVERYHSRTKRVMTLEDAQHLQQASATIRHTGIEQALKRLALRAKIS
jgi:hypothetical protein